MASYPGIDYGMGMSNVDRETGIRYGVISLHSLDCQTFADSTTPTFPGPNCPECGGDVIPSEEVKHVDLWARRMDRNGTHGCFDHACLSCRKGWDSGDCYGEEADGWECSDSDYELSPAFSGFCVFVTRSPFYTRATFCSPCAPGAGDLNSPMEEGVKTYCLGHEWFSEEDPCPYPVYRVSDDMRVDVALSAEVAA